MWLLAVLGVGGLLLAALYYLVAGEANWWLYLLAVVSLVAVVVYGLVVSLSEVASMGAKRFADRRDPGMLPLPIGEESTSGGN